MQRLKLWIIGSAEGDGYGRPPANKRTWRDHFLAEIEGNYNPAKVHFIGKLDYLSYLRVLQKSWVHVYLSIPFVLSWSMLEAMSCGCTVVGSSTAPVQEVIQHKKNGLLTDFFDPSTLAQNVSYLVEDSATRKTAWLCRQINNRTEIQPEKMRAPTAFSHSTHCKWHYKQLRIRLRQE